MCYGRIGFRRNGCRLRGLSLLQTEHSTLRGSVCDISADDLVFVYQQGCVYRFGCAGIVVDLIHIAHNGLSGESAQIIALTFL